MQRDEILSLPPPSKLRDSWMVSKDVTKEMDAFNVLYMGRITLPVRIQFTVPRSLLYDLCSTGIVPTRSIDIGSLSPCRESLLQHINRVNYQLGIWK